MYTNFWEISGSTGNIFYSNLNKIIELVFKNKFQTDFEGRMAKMG